MAQETFELVIATDNNEEMYKALQHPCGAYFLTGRRNLGYESYPLILKLSETGSIQELPMIRLDTNGFFPSMEFLDNGNIMLIGHCKLNDTVLKFDHLWLCEIDTNLNIIQEKTYYMLRNDYYEYLNWNSVRDVAGNIVLAGNYIYYPGHHDMIYAKVSQNLDTMFTKYYHYQFGQFMGPIFQQPDGNYLSVVQHIYSTDPLSLVELDSIFIIIDITATPIEYGDLQGMTITWLNDSVYLKSANRYDLPSENSQIGVTLNDSNHQILSEIIFDKPDTIDWAAWDYCHSYLDDTTIYVCGFENPLGFFDPTPTTVFLYLIDKDLNVLGELDFGGDVNYEIHGVTVTNDGGCLVYGKVYDNPEGIHEYDIFIRKLLRNDIELLTRISVADFSVNSQHSFPNPAFHTLNIPLSGIEENITLSIYDLSGRIVFRKHYSERGNLIQIDIDNLQVGTYLYTINYSDKKLCSSKFIKF